MSPIEPQILKKGARKATDQTWKDDVKESGKNLLMTAKELSDIFEWVDHIPLSRAKKNINRDFSDGVMFAEILSCFFPKLVDLHNYVAASSVAQKKNNWEVLNTKVMHKIGLKLTNEHIVELAQGKIGAIELALKEIYSKVRVCEIEKEQKMAAARGDGNDGDNSLAGSTSREDVCQVYGSPESGLTYKGIKMVPVSYVEEKDTRIKDLEHSLKELRKKVRRQETLVALKEEHLQDLTFQLHEFRLKEEKGKVAAATPPKLNRWIDPTGLV